MTDGWLRMNQQAGLLLTDNKTANHNLYYLNLFFYLLSNAIYEFLNDK